MPHSPTKSSPEPTSNRSRSYSSSRSRRSSESSSRSRRSSPPRSETRRSSRAEDSSLNVGERVIIIAEGTHEDRMSVLLFPSSDDVPAERREQREHGPAYMAVPLPPAPASTKEHNPGVQPAPSVRYESTEIRLGAGSAALRDPLPRTRFGLNVAGQGAQGLGAPRDYRQKYAADPPYKELDPEARVWLIYNDESTIFDHDMIVESSDNLDILLVFAGLFSGVLTTFVAQTSQALSPDNTAISNSILLELVALQRAQANGTSLASIPAADMSFTVARSDIWVNGLWFTSLALSLTTALLAVLAKQWLRQYSSFITGSTRTRALIRQFRYACFDKWGVRLLIGLLPTVLHISLFLFITGLVVFLYSLNRALARVVACIGGFLFGAYMITNILPIFAIRCPYRTPLSAVLYPLYEPGSALISLVMKVTISILITPYVFARGALGSVGLMTKKKHWLPSVAVHLPARMGTTLREAERAYVNSEEKLWTHTALTWLARTTSEPSAKIALVEALGAEEAPGPLDRDPLLPVFTQQWVATASRLVTGEPSALSDDMILGRLIRATISQATICSPDTTMRPGDNIPILSIHTILNGAITGHSHEPIDTMLNSLPPTPISVSDHATILAIAACYRTSRFPWGDQQEVVLPPHDAFNFVLDHYAKLAQLVVPTWMWWSICTQAALGPPTPEEQTNSEALRLFQTCIADDQNIVRYEMQAWLAQLLLPADLQRAVEMYLRDELRPYPYGRLYSPVSLATFLGVYFPNIQKYSRARQPPASRYIVQRRIAVVTG
ncbi:hypothetical protein DFH09DRAFT_1002900 [Mycena vulgaris]|nr:hypothetical protein DFH09DRAFT_1002900 [Mycena vulgaris]